MPLIMKASREADLYVWWFDGPIFVGGQQEMVAHLAANLSPKTGYDAEALVAKADEFGTTMPGRLGDFGDPQGLILADSPLWLARDDLERFLTLYRTSGMAGARTVLQCHPDDRADGGGRDG